MDVAAVFCCCGSCGGAAAQLFRHLRLRRLRRFHGHDHPSSTHNFVARVGRSTSRYGQSFPARYLEHRMRKYRIVCM